MEIRPLKTEADYDAALKEIERYFEHEPKPGSRKAERFDLLALAIEHYERQHWPIDPPDPVEAIKYRMAQAGYRQTDFANLIGSRSRASEILNRKRHLTLQQVWTLVRKWSIPAESLIKPYRVSRSGLKGAAKSLRRNARQSPAR